jgi:transposase-like protein
MQKVQKTYTAELKREAIRLAQTSGKSVAKARPRVGQFRHEGSSMAEGTRRIRFPGLSREWVSNRPRRGDSPTQARIRDRQAGA